MISLSTATGDELRAAIPDLARLRIRVFRDFPYLYEGQQSYEEEYLQTYSAAPGAFVALARDGQQVVGASTALPLVQETAEVQRPFLNNPEFELGEVLYLGESVLLPQYRGQGLGHKFFDAREAYAEEFGLSVTAFCAVQRSSDHPLRPRPYRTLNAFWQARGYTERPDLQTTMTWQDVGETHESAKAMRFWVRRVALAAK